MTNQISRDEVRSAIEDKLCAHFGVTSKNATDDQVFRASAIVIREIMSRLLAFEEEKTPDREVHYLSMEFLMGRSLMKNAFNLGISEALTGALSDLGRNASDIFEEENDAGLGNGGLGRLAACYMDSMATLGIPATGYSICYELGIFRQKIVDGKQTEVADDWRKSAESWLIPRNEDAVEVRFGGHISSYWDGFGRYHAEHQGYTTVTAVPRDMLIAGYGGNRINTLRLWDARSTNALDMYLFSEGEYVKSMEQRTMSEVITKVLYPADDHIEGKQLRLKQQYFFVSATAQTIVKKHVERWGDIRSFAKHPRHPRTHADNDGRIRSRLGRGVEHRKLRRGVHEPHRYERGARKVAAVARAEPASEDMGDPVRDKPPLVRASDLPLRQRRKDGAQPHNPGRLRAYGKPLPCDLL